MAEDQLVANRRLRKAVTRLLKGALNHALCQWIEYAHSRGSMMALIRKVAARWVLMDLGLGFSRWRECYHHTTHQRQTVHSALSRLVNSRMFALWHLWRELVHCSRVATHALARITQAKLHSAVLQWCSVCSSVKLARDAREKAKRAAEWAPDAWLLGPDGRYGGEGARRQFAGVVEIAKEDLSAVHPRGVEWDVTGRDHGGVEWDRSGRQVLSPVGELDATELLRERMETMNAMFDQVESMTLDLEREIFQPNTTQLAHTRRVPVAGGRKPSKSNKPKSQDHDGRWPAPTK